MNLYELSNEWLQLQAVDIETVEEGEDWIKAVEEIEASIRDKLLAIARVVKNLEAEETALKDEEARLYAKRKARTNRIASLKEYAEIAMISAGLRDVQDSVFKVSIQKNPPYVFIPDERLIPAEYWIPQPDKLNKTAIKAALKDGQEVGGAELKQSEGIRIK